MDRFKKLVAEFLPLDIKHYSRGEVRSRMELAFRLGENCGLASALRKLETPANLDSDVDIATGGG